MFGYNHCWSGKHLQVLQLLRQNPKEGYITSLTKTTPFTVQLIILQKPRVSIAASSARRAKQNSRIIRLLSSKAYRSNNDDFYYVSKDIKIEENQDKLFAGYLVKGGIGLYHFLVLGKDYYLFEGENGETAGYGCFSSGLHELIPESRNHVRIWRRFLGCSKSIHKNSTTSMKVHSTTKICLR